MVKGANYRAGYEVKSTKLYQVVKGVNYRAGYEGNQPNYAKW